MFLLHLILLDKLKSKLVFVGRTGDVSTGNGVRRFTYDVLPGIDTGDNERATVELGRATDGWDQEK